MTHPHHTNDRKQQLQYERERKELLAENYALLAAIAQKPYALKLLKSVRQGLLMHLNYKANRQ